MNELGSKIIEFPREERNCGHSLMEGSVLDMKKALRKRAKAELKSYFADKELGRECARSVTDFFVSCAQYKDASVILAFMAMEDEIDLSAIIRAALKDGKKVAVPKMVAGTSQMDFYYIDSIDNMETSFEKDPVYGIREPSPLCQMVRPETLPQNTVMLIPGLAFNLKGARLGRGKGYYDRYLQRVLSGPDGKSIVRCGVCPVNVITRMIPVEKNDVPMTHLLNEYGFTAVSR